MTQRPLGGRGVLTLGSAPGNDVVIDVTGVSRQHARLDWDAGQFVLTDLSSKNGIVHDGRRVPSVALSTSDVVQLGGATLTLEEISSLDGKAAVSLLIDASSVGPPHETAGIEDGSSPAAALRLVRELGETLPNGPVPRGVMERARAILGAEALVVATLGGDGQLVVKDCWGGLTAEAAKRIEQALRAPETPGVLVARAEEAWLAAAFAGATIAAWVTDFFGYLSRLSYGAKTDTAASEARPARALVFPPEMVVGSSPAMLALLAGLRAGVESDRDVLLTGETGTGKELIAKVVHQSGPSSRGPLIAVNCAAIPGELLEAELFGVAARVATGVDPRPGLFSRAENGSLFLDEIGELPRELQAKLLRVLQEREVMPLGAAAAKRIHVRVISASNRNLGELVADGAFRADLYYRLAGLEYRLPPLRDRKEDVPELVVAFMNASARKYRKKLPGISRRALDSLAEHPWPGNVRELANAVDNAVLSCPKGALLESKHFALGKVVDVPPVVLRPEPRTLEAQLADVQRRAIVGALDECGGNKTKAARLLGITRNGLALMMKRLGIE